MSENLSFDRETNTLTVGHTTGVVYKINGRVVEGEVPLHKTSTVVASTLPGYFFAKGVKTSFRFEVSDTPEETPPADPDVQTESTDPEDADSTQVDYGL